MEWIKKHGTKNGHNLYHNYNNNKINQTQKPHSWQYALNSIEASTISFEHANQHETWKNFFEQHRTSQKTFQEDNFHISANESFL